MSDDKKVVQFFPPKPHQERPSTATGGAVFNFEPEPQSTLFLKDWLKRDLPEADNLLGKMLSTTSRMLLVGPTGLGKTMFALAAALAIASSKAFLHWCAPSHPCRVLYVDGEMSRRQMRKRLIDAVRHAGVEPEGLLVLSKEDFEDMPPLNTELGQEWMNAFIEKHGPFDLIVFDNIQALLVGDMKDEEQWAKVLPWVRDLTSRPIGQMWLHHTGHDETKSYGSKAREWQMDIVALMERVPDAPKGELWFSLKFTKARERTSDNLADFDEVTLKLIEDEWIVEVGKKTPRKLSGNNKLVFDALTKALLKDGKTPPASNDIPPNTPVVSEQLWRECALRALPGDENRVKNQAIKRAVTKLIEDHYVGRWDGKVWMIRE